MQENTCKTCKHFRQHYVRFGRNSYEAIAVGHCAHPRLKQRRPDTKACDHYVKKSSSRTKREVSPAPAAIEEYPEKG